jgi:PadR family transcriptional regulator, regulatory protein PadR
MHQEGIMEETINKVFDGGSPNYSLSALEEDILTALLGRELYGLQISKAIEEASLGSRIIGMGSLYPTLRRLEAKGFVNSCWESGEGGKELQRTNGTRRRYYRITPTGSKALTDNRTMRERLLQWQPI